jgi:hypothetical protein
MHNLGRVFLSLGRKNDGVAKIPIYGVVAHFCSFGILTCMASLSKIHYSLDIEIFA